ncbi:Potassium channel domain-containing protein (plasmid) [Cupriavidus necator]|uniref:potassium channel family protein n=1 Tax=Cupriavidus necator TaxID=106590 RepID=UPI003F736859
MTDSFRYIALHGVESHDDPRAIRAWRWIQWVLLALSLLAIPAFFLDLAAGPPILFRVSQLLYLVIFAGFFASFSLVVLLSRRRKHLILRNQFEALILIGAAVSFVWGTSTWSSLEWVLRDAFMCAVGIRTALFLRRYFSPNRLLLLFALGAALLALSGAGFYWLEPRVHSYGEGLWLAFESSATVGYGDIAPTTPASPIFAIFVVLLGYGMLSLVFASIAAMFIGEEEKLLRREMHADIKRLHDEVALLHKELRELREAVDRDTSAVSQESPTRL